MTNDDNWDDLFYDPSTKRKLFKVLGGCSLVPESKSKYVKIYHKFLGILLIFYFLWFLVTVYRTLKTPVEFIESFHFLMVAQMILYNYFVELFCRDYNNEALKMLKDIFITYNQTISQEITLLKKKRLKNIIWSMRIYNYTMVFACTGYILLTPLKNYFFPQYRGRVTETGVNTRLPIPVYLPSQDFTILQLAFFAQSFYFYLIYIHLTSIFESYVCFIIQVQSEFELLNYSINNIEQRALEKFNKLSIINISLPKLYMNSIFQKCLYECIKEDILHHQAIIRCMEKLKLYIGTSLLEFSVVTPMTAALQGYIICTNGIALDQMLKSGFTASAEFIFLSIFSILNEEIATSSSEMFINIYSLPWQKYIKKTNEVLRIFQTNSMRPILFRMSIFNVYTNCELLLSMVSTIFSYINLLRNFT